MGKREKRLEKGIESLELQKKLHEEKRKIAKELGKLELIKYYTKEIELLEKRRKDREEKLNRKD